MFRFMMKSAMALVVFAATAQPVYADEAAKPVPEAKVFVTKHKGKFNGVNVAYTATAKETHLKNKKGDVAGAMFSVSYVKDGVKDPTTRPVSFFFNGGPGSASLWLHLGAWGPKRVIIPSDAKDDGAPPYPIEHNPTSLLDVTDMVFIDPIGTGFSQLVGKGKAEDFIGVDADAKSVAKFIRMWLTENKRWNSPKYLGGESYGTTRSAAVVRELEGAYNDVSLNGIILISAILDFSIDRNREGNEMPYIMMLPTFATTAQYHGKAGEGKTTPEFAEEARQFAIGEFATALLKGSALKGEERSAILKKLSYFTGVSETYLDQANLRLSLWRYMKELLRDEGKTVGRLDGRYTGKDYDNAGSGPDQDPSFYGIDGAYTAAINDYLGRDLKVDMGDRQFSVIGGLPGKWDWMSRSAGAPFYFNVAPYIGKALRENSGLRVFLASGYYDFATPFFGAEYSLSRGDMDERRIVKEYYESGHMMYAHKPSLLKLNNDIRRFIKEGGTGRD